MSFSGNLTDEQLAILIAASDYNENISIQNNNNNNNSNNNDNHYDRKDDIIMINNNPILRGNNNSIPNVLKEYINNNIKVDISMDVTQINPNIHDLFLKYNTLYFDNKLSACVIEWSKRYLILLFWCLSFQIIMRVHK